MLEPQIVIFINHNLEILNLIEETMPYLPGWKFHTNAYPTNPHWKPLKKKIGTFFRFDFKNQVFEWYGEHAPPDTHVVPIRTLAAASKLMDVLYIVTTKAIDPITAIGFVHDNLPSITG